MNILNKFTWRSLKLNKKRTIVTIIGIILSTALICATAGLVTSFQRTLINRTIENTGNFHAMFFNIPQEEQIYITNHRQVSEYMVSQNMGYAMLENSENEYKPYLCLKAYDEKALNNLGIQLIEGKLPQNDEEVIISNHIITDAKIKYKIGDKIVLDISDRMIDGYLLTQENPLINDEEEGQEHLEKLYTKEFTIVGIMERPDYLIEPYSAPGYTVITKLQENTTGTYDIAVLYNNVRDAFEITEEIGGEYTYNSDLLRWEGVSQNDYTNAMLYSVAGIVIAIIMVSSIFVIRNSFSISVTEKYKQYGMLASVGATSKQIRNNILYEGLLLTLIGIPLGILGGIFAVYVLVIVVNLILGEFSNMEFVFHIKLFPVILSAIISAITIYLSCLIPARKAAKISPIDAIRSNNDIKVKGKKLRTPKLFKKVFKVGGEIALKNLKRSKKKYRTTVISIVVSIVIFISLNSFLDFGFKLTNIYYENLNYDVSVSYYNNDGNLSKFYDEIIKLDNVDRYCIPTSAVMELIGEEYVNTKVGSGYYDENGEYITQVIIMSLGEQEYNRYVKEVGGNPEQYENAAILYDTSVYYSDGKQVEEQCLNVKAGDTIEGKIYVSSEPNSEQKDFSIKIAKRTDARAMGISSVYGRANLIVTDEFMKQFPAAYTGTLYIESANSTELVNDIKKIIEDNDEYDSSGIIIENYDDMIRENNAVITVISIFLYGFITVITLIGVTNIFNTITTNMALRSKEFAMLKSIGMTKKEFNRMIRLESILYGLKSLIIGIPLGIALSYAIYEGFANKLDTQYILPINAILIAIVFVFIIISITMKYSMNKINKQNIIETIRNDNI